MGWFGRKDKVIDLTEHYRKQQEKEMENQQKVSPPISSDSGSDNGFGFFGAMAGANDQQSTSTSSDTLDLTASPSSGVGSDSNDKKRKLAKRLMEMTDKLEDLSNQIYHLQQRVELVERKTGL